MTANFPPAAGLQAAEITALRAELQIQTARANALDASRDAAVRVAEAEHRSRFLGEWDDDLGPAMELYARLRPGTDTHEIQHTDRALICAECGQIVIRESPDGPYVHARYSKVIYCRCTAPVQTQYCQLHDRAPLPRGKVLTGE